MRKALLLVIVFLPVFVSGAFLGIEFDGDGESGTPTDSSDLQWFFDGSEYNLALNLESADLSKEYIVNFGLSDAFIFDGTFPSTAFLVHAFASTDQTFVVSELTGDCDFFLVGNVFGDTDFSRIVLREQSFPLSILMDESVFLMVDGDAYETCRLGFESGDGEKVLNFSVNFKFVPSAYEILLPHLVSCGEAPQDKCFVVGGVEYNYSELVDRRGCLPEVFLGGTEVDGGPPRACDEAEKERLRKEKEDADKRILELEETQQPELKADIQGFQKLFEDLNKGFSEFVRDKDDFDDSLNIGVLAFIFVVGIALAYKFLYKPSHRPYSGGEHGGELMAFDKVKGVLSGVKDAIRKPKVDEEFEKFAEAKLGYDEPKPLEEVIPSKNDLSEKVVEDMKEAVGFSEADLDNTGVNETIEHFKDVEENADEIALEEKTDDVFELSEKEKKKSE